MSSTVWVPILVAVIASTPGTLVALSGRKHAKGANDAVNNRPADAPKLVDVVVATARDVEALGKGQTRIQTDLREVRKETASVAVALGQHLADVDSLER